MKKFNLILILAFLATAVSAQEVKFPPLDASPADILYYPLNAAKVKTAGDGKPVIKVIYSRPAKKGREIFGVLEQYGKVWRLGANEETEIRFFAPVTIGGKEIEAGTYSLFAIPNKDKWEVILNKQTNKWGAYSYDQSTDVVRTEVKTTALDAVVEHLSMTFVPQSNGASLVIAWDKTRVELPILFSL